MMIYTSSLIFLALGSCAYAALVPLRPSENYTHALDADQSDQDQYKLFWKLIGDDEVQFETHCKSTGWVGIGLSPNGGMVGSDIAVGWVSNGKAYLKVDLLHGFVI
jgi:hypothetical protein